MPTSSQPETPIVEKYRPLGHLGVGGMGRVFHGRIDFPLRQARSCAIKTIRPDRFNAKGIARFTHEAMIGWDLTGHRNIITTRSFDEWPDGRLYVVLDREGPSLHDVFLQLRGQFGIIHLITRHMLNALAHLQSNRIIHGDISTGNILLGRDGHAKLSDFGLSRRADAHGNAEDSGRLAGGLIGVAAYTSPETLNGAPPTFASDLYSLGAVLHELAAGRPPHGSYDFTEMIIRVQLDPPGHLPSKTPDALARLIRGLTRKDPAQRLSVEEASAILEQSSAPRVDEHVIAMISSAWVQNIKKEQDLDSPCRTQGDLLDAATRHISRIHAAEQPPDQLPDHPAPPEPRQVSGPDPDPRRVPEPHPRPHHRRAHLIAGILAILLALSLALLIRQADDKHVETPRSDTAKTSTIEESPTATPPSPRPANTDPQPVQHHEAPPISESQPPSVSYDEPPSLQPDGLARNPAPDRADPDQRRSRDRTRDPRPLHDSVNTPAYWSWTTPDES